MMGVEDAVVCAEACEAARANATTATKKGIWPGTVHSPNVPGVDEVVELERGEEVENSKSLSKLEHR